MCVCAFSLGVCVVGVGGCGGDAVLVFFFLFFTFAIDFLYYVNVQRGKTPLYHMQTGKSR